MIQISHGCCNVPEERNAPISKIQRFSNSWLSWRERPVPNVVREFRSIRENLHKSEGGAIEYPLKFGLCRS